MFSAVGSIRESLCSLDLFVRKTKIPLIMKLFSLWTFFFRYIVLKGKLSVQFANNVPKEIKAFLNIVTREYVDPICVYKMSGKVRDGVGCYISESFGGSRFVRRGVWDLQEVM
jgi:hypothetical protein